MLFTTSMCICYMHPCWEALIHVIGSSGRRKAVKCVMCSRVGQKDQCSVASDGSGLACLYAVCSCQPASQPGLAAQHLYLSGFVYLWTLVCMRVHIAVCFLVVPKGTLAVSTSCALSCRVYGISPSPRLSRA